MTDIQKFVNEEIRNDENLSLEEKCEKVKSAIGYASQKDISQIEELTIEQNSSEVWHKARYCRITASRCHEVMTRMKTIEKDVSQNTENLVKRLLYPKKICTPAMEKGRIWEEKAFDKYKRVMELEDHCNLAVTKCGLVIGKEVVVGASPDGLISCGCHGEGVIEIKSATKFEDQDPNVKEVIEKLPYIQKNGKKMKTQHKYYSQVQFQMGLTGRRWCHLVVFTPKCLEANVKPLIVYVKFDEAWFQTLVHSSMKFWYGHLLPEIIGKKLYLGMTKRNEKITSNNEDHTYGLCSEGNNLSGSNCPVCHTICKDEEEVNTFIERSIGCDNCNAWFHFGCVQMNSKKLKEIGDKNWYCVLCAKENI